MELCFRCLRVYYTRANTGFFLLAFCLGTVSPLCDSLNKVIETLVIRTLILSLTGQWMPSLSTSEQSWNRRNTSLGFPELWGTEMNLSVHIYIRGNTGEREIILKSDSAALGRVSSCCLVKVFDEERRLCVSISC